MSATGVEAAIQDLLDALELEAGGRVLYACDGGRGAWGLPPAGEVREVRCVYAHPTAWYLSIEGHRRRDQVELPVRDGIQVVGQDLRKTLAAFHAGSAPLFEWLVSPAVHAERGALAGRLRELRPVYFAPRISVFHYLHQARRAYRRYLGGAAAGERRYHETLLPVLAMRWIEAGHGVLPGSFVELVELTLPDVGLRRAVVERDPDDTSDDRAIDDLLDRELDRFARIPDVEPRKEPGWDELDDLFREILAADAPDHDGGA